MSVPGAEGLKLFLITIGIDLATAGPIASACSTFAPKHDISIASSYVICDSTNADETALGSALSTPSTSVQISIIDAPSAAPMMAAVQSDPFLPIVVVRPSSVWPMNPVTTGTGRRDCRQNDEKYSRAARFVFGKITLAWVNCSSVVRNLRASTNRVRRNWLRYADTM